MMQLSRRPLLAGLGATALGAALPGLRPARAAPSLTGKATALSFPGSPFWDQWMYFKDRVESSGTVSLEYFLQGETGNEEEQVNALRRNRLQIGAMTFLGLSAQVPELSLIMAPYLFDSLEEADFVFDNHLTPLIDDLLRGKGLVFVDYAEVGWSNLFAKEPILTPQQAAGVKLRASPNPASQAFLEAVDADRAAIGSNDVVPALQTGLISGGTGSIVYYASVLADLAPHITLTEHAYEGSAIVANRRWWDGASAAERQVMLDAQMPVADKRSGVRVWTQARLDALADEGRITVHPLDAEAKAEWRAACQGQIEALVADIGGRSAELLQTVRAGQEDFKASAG